jgi:hypothetical protein
MKNKNDVPCFLTSQGKKLDKVNGTTLKSFVHSGTKQ